MGELLGYKEACSYFDLTDRETSITIAAIKEHKVDRDSVILQLTNKLYDYITKNITKIDYGSIPYTKGDITRLPEYKDLMDCIDVIEGVLKEYHQQLYPTLTIKTAINNLKKDKDIYRKGYASNVDFIIMTYNNTVMSIVGSVSLLISTCLEFFSDPHTNQFKISLDKTALKNSRESLMFKSVERYNKIAATGELNDTFEKLIKVRAKNFDGATAALIIGGSILLFNIIPILRELTYYYYYSRASFSEYIEQQADLLRVNAMILDNKGGKENKASARKQREIADKFQRISDKFAVIDKEASKKTKDQITKEDRNKLKIDDVADHLPDSAASALF